ncbi:hypothetical protein [Arthrobacter echini]|nr:hypothetical protein [Arthrobacter echini]
MENKDQDATAPVPEKQIHRWKDDGGPVIVEPDDEPEQEASDKN